jgi:hypothetical protein
VVLFIGIVVYYILAVIAMFQYPEGFDVLNDLWTHLRWFEYNADGALFFRVGSSIYGLALLVFFLSFSGRITADAEPGFRKRFIQIMGISIAVSIMVGEILADQSTVFTVASGLNLILTIIILIGVTISLYNQPTFWKPSIVLFIVGITLSSYLLFLGVIDAPIRDFRIVDLLTTAVNQASIFTVAFNLTRNQNH